MLKTPQTWWEQETDSSILLLNRGFLEAEQKKDEFKSLFERSTQWVIDAGVDEKAIADCKAKIEAQVKHQTETNHEFERIFLRDAERAFVSTKNQTTMMTLLTILKRDVLEGDYHQGAGLICAFLLLTLSPAETLALLTTTATHSKYLPSFFKAASVACATDGYLWKDQVEERYPAVGNKLTQNFILPETFVQKWFCALCVHVLPFSGLFPFFDLFYRDGHAFLFRFGLSLVNQFQDDLVACTTQAQIYAILRLEAPSVTTSEAISNLVNEANLVVVDEHSVDLAALRQAAYDKHLRQRIESAARAHAQLDEETKNEGTCDFCQSSADYWCRDCSKYICDDCRDAEPAPEPHIEDTHNVVDIEDKDNEDDDY